MMQTVRINPSLPILSFATLLACGPDQPTVEPAASTNASEPAPSESDPEQAPTPIVDALGCQVLLTLAVERGKGRASGVVTLQARAKNLTDAALQLTLEDHCPNGSALFSGLAPEYDYYHTCTMGMCMREPSKVIALPPGELVDVESTLIHVEGQGCNGPISPGTSELSFSLALLAGANNPVLCGPEPVALRK
jgi:hypothetical protein